MELSFCISNGYIKPFRESENSPQIAADGPPLARAHWSGNVFDSSAKRPFDFHAGTAPVFSSTPLHFVGDAICQPGAVSRCIKCLTVTDDYTHECVDITTDFGIGGHYVTRLLDRAALFRGYPQSVRTDNGPEFTCRAFIPWAQKHGIQHILIEPGSPMQNAYIESFDGTFRDECLDENWFESLEQARVAIATWRLDYNETRPHSSCGHIPPATFAIIKCQLIGDSSQTSKTDTKIS